MKSLDWLMVWIILASSLLFISRYIDSCPSKPTYQDFVEKEPWEKIKEILDTTPHDSSLWAYVRYRSDVQQCSIFVTCEKPKKPEQLTEKKQ